MTEVVAANMPTTAIARNVSVERIYELLCIQWFIVRIPLALEF
jgi:hypothetical protein